MNDWTFIEQNRKSNENQGNRLKEIRVGLGLTITALSKAANVSTKVISQTERSLTMPTQVTKNKILNGLNAGLSPSEKKLEFNDVFPND